MITTEIVPDDAGLRQARRHRLLAEMEAAGVDVLVVGREANARYVSGVPRLWLAGTRPYGPGCILVRGTGAVHLLTSWDEGVPDDIPHEHLIGFTFNPGNQVKALRAIEGSAEFRTVATDALNPMTAGLLPRAFPNATIVDGGPLLQRARRTKTAAEIETLRAAVGIAERCTAAAAAALAPGTTEQHLAAVFMEEMGRGGVCMPSIQDVVWRTSPATPTARVGRGAPLVDGELVTIAAGVMVDGYAGEMTRTLVVGSAGAGSDDGRSIGAADSLLRQTDDLLRRLLDVCRPGTSCSELLRVYADAGLTPPVTPVAHGLGLGFDHPTVLAALPRTAAEDRFEEGMVLAVTASVWQHGVGAAVVTEPVVVTADGARSLVGGDGAAGR